MTYVRQKDSVTTYLNQMLYGKRVKPNPASDMWDEEDYDITGMMLGWDTEYSAIRVRWNGGTIELCGSSDLLLI